MNAQVKGTFAIRSSPNPNRDLGDGFVIGHLTFHKEFQGPLTGTSVVEMLGMMFRDKGSGGYVALERFQGALGERSGTFALQHSSIMTRGTAVQHIVVVPDSGTDGLAGLVGSMSIDVVEGKHHYTFDYVI